MEGILWNKRRNQGFSLCQFPMRTFKMHYFIREKRKNNRMGLIIAFVVVCICTIFAYRYRTYHRMKVVKTITKELTESFQSFAYKKGTICYSEDGISFLDGKGNEKWNKTYSINDVQLRTSEHRSMYSYVRLSIDRCTATYV